MNQQLTSKERYSTAKAALKANGLIDIEADIKARGMHSKHKDYFFEIRVRLKKDHVKLLRNYLEAKIELENDKVVEGAEDEAKRQEKLKNLVIQYLAAFPTPVYKMWWFWVFLPLILAVIFAGALFGIIIIPNFFLCCQRRSSTL
jgi:hypothetical protein